MEKEHGSWLADWDSSNWTFNADHFVKLVENQYNEYRSELDKQDQSVHASAIEIPHDPQEFMDDFGQVFLLKDGTYSSKLTPYQSDWWRKGWEGWHYRGAIKSNKIGFSTSNLLELAQHGLTDCAGYEMLIFAQNHDMAKDHLKTLRQLFSMSEKYRPFMITHAKDYLLKDDVTKVTEMFLENPYNKYRKTSIKALSTAASGSVSWKNVKYILCSDLTMSSRPYDEIFSGLLTRLANTEGYFTFETIPNGPVGEVYRIWKEYRMPNEDRSKLPTAFQWYIAELPYMYGVMAGLISEQFIEAERFNQGKRFKQKYECSFEVSQGTVFTQEQLANMRILGKQYSTINPYERIYPKAMGIDTQSRFAIVITCQVDGYIVVIYADQEEEPDLVTKIKEISRLIHQFGVTKLYIDASNRDFVRTLSKRLGYPIDPDKKNINEWSDLNNFGLFNPVNWGPMQVEMITHMQMLASRGILAVDDDQHPELMAQMTTAEERNYKLISKIGGGETYDELEAYEVQLLNYRPARKAIQ
jgi:hypothetical protein